MLAPSSELVWNNVPVCCWSTGTAGLICLFCHAICIISFSGAPFVSEFVSGAWIPFGVSNFGSYADFGGSVGVVLRNYGINLGNWMSSMVFIQYRFVFENCQGFLDPSPVPRALCCYDLGLRIVFVVYFRDMLSYNTVTFSFTKWNFWNFKILSCILSIIIFW